jgi:hypothetical protein
MLKSDPYFLKRFRNFSLKPRFQVPGRSAVMFVKVFLYNRKREVLL